MYAVVFITGDRTSNHRAETLPLNPHTSDATLVSHGNCVVNQPERFLQVTNVLFYRGHSHLQGNVLPRGCEFPILAGSISCRRDHSIHCWWEPNKFETAVQCFVSRAQVFARFSGRSNSIQNIIPLLQKENVHLVWNTLQH